MEKSKPSAKIFHILYKTTCLITGCFYIGIHSTNKLNDGYLGSGLYLRNSIKKYGRINHTVEILEKHETRLELISREAEVVTEQLIADPLCMNLIKGGTANDREFGCTEKSRLLMSAASKAAVRTKEWYDKVVASRRTNNSYGHTDEVCEKIRSVRTGSVLSEETKNKISKSNTGKKRSAETCQNISASLKGKTLGRRGTPKTEEQKEHLRQCNLGKKKSDESKEKMRLAKQRRREAGLQLGHGHKACTIDGIEIFSSVNEMLKKLGRGKKGTGHPNFRFVDLAIK